MTAHCESCGKVVDDNTCHYRDDASLFCDECAEAMSLQCCLCGSIEPMWQMSSTSKDEIYCQSCATAIA